MMRMLTTAQQQQRLSPSLLWYRVANLHNTPSQDNMPQFRNNDPVATTSISRQMELLEIVKAMSNRLDLLLSDESLEAVVDLLQAGVAPDAVVAMVTHLHHNK